MESSYGSTNVRADNIKPIAKKNGGILNSIVEVVSVEVDKAKEAIKSIMRPHRSVRNSHATFYLRYCRKLTLQKHFISSNRSSWFQHVFCFRNPQVTAICPLSSASKNITKIEERSREPSKGQLLFIRRITFSKKCSNGDINGINHLNEKVQAPLQNTSTTPNSGHKTPMDKSSAKVIESSWFSMVK